MSEQPEPLEASDEFLRFVTRAASQYDGLCRSMADEILALREHKADLEARVTAVTQERDELQAVLDALAWPAQIPPSDDGTPNIIEHFRSMAARITQSRDELKHANRKLTERAEIVEAQLTAVRAGIAALIEQWRKAVAIHEAECDRHQKGRGGDLGRAAAHAEAAGKIKHCADDLARLLGEGR